MSIREHNNQEHIVMAANKTQKTIGDIRKGVDFFLNTYKEQDLEQDLDSLYDMPHVENTSSAFNKSQLSLLDDKVEECDNQMQDLIDKTPESSIRSTLSERWDEVKKSFAKFTKSGKTLLRLKSSGKDKDSEEVKKASNDLQENCKEVNKNINSLNEVVKFLIREAKGLFGAFTEGMNASKKGISNLTKDMKSHLEDGRDRIKILLNEKSQNKHLGQYKKLYNESHSSSNMLESVHKGKESKKHASHATAGEVKTKLLEANIDRRKDERFQRHKKEKSFTENFRSGYKKGKGISNNELER